MKTQAVVNIQTLTDIANAIIQRGGYDCPMTPSEMPNAIQNIKEDRPHFIEVEGAYWEQDPKWQELGETGTKVVFNVGNANAPLLSVSVYCQNTVSTDPATIDWGDGTTTVMAKNTTATRVYHEYQTPGDYTVLVNDKLQRFAITTTTLPANSTVLNGIVRNSAFALRQVVHYGSKLKSLAGAFYDCRYLNCGCDDEKYDQEYPPFPPNITDASNVYTNCVEYHRHITSLKRLTKCTTCSNTFYNNNRMIGNVQTLPPNVTGASGTFYGCSDLTGGIPYNVFPDSLSATLTTCSSCFYACWRLTGEYPKISHLTKCTSFASLFSGMYQIGAGYDFPELPIAPNCTSIASMFYDNRSATNIKPYDFETAFPKLTSMQSTFYQCYNIAMPCPKIPSTVTAANGLYQTFYCCYKMTGTFPTLPTGYASSMHSTFASCRNIKGQLPDIPAGVTYLYQTFSGCRRATGKFPSLGNIVYAGNDQNFCASLFSECYDVTEPPDTFFSPEKCPNITSFASMFAYCRGLTSFEHDMSGFAKVTNVGSMFRDCYKLENLSLDKLPPNITSMTYIAYLCRSLDCNIPQWPAKVTNASYAYSYANRLKPMLNASGQIETDYTKLYKPTITTYSSICTSSSWEVQKQFYDACVAGGKAGTYYGSVNVTWL